MNSTRAMFLVMMLLAGVASGAERKAPAKAAGNEGSQAFSLITERNIFNPDRVRDRTAASAQEESTPTTQTATAAVASEQLNLLGTWITPERTIAFVNAQPGGLTSATVGTELGGWQVSAVNSQDVQLRGPTETITWPVGQRLERSGEGSWELKGSVLSTSGSTTSSAMTSAGKGVSGKVSDVMKRMMERRRRERNR